MSRNVGISDLSCFVRESLEADLSDEDIAAAAAAAGWSPGEVRNAISSWQRVVGAPPVPRPRRADPRSAALPAMIIAFGAITWGIIQSSFSVIDAFFDVGGGVRGVDGARWGAAVLIVMAPLLMFLGRAAREVTGRDGNAAGKIASTLSVISFGSLSASMVSAVYAALSGEASIAFMAKSMVVTTVSLGALLMASGIHSPEKRAVSIRMIAAASIATAIFVIVMAGGPAEGLKERGDLERLSRASEAESGANCVARSVRGSEDVPGQDIGCIMPGPPNEYSVRVTEDGEYEVCAITRSRRYEGQGC